MINWHITFIVLSGIFACPVMIVASNKKYDLYSLFLMTIAWGFAVASAMAK